MYSFTFKKWFNITVIVLVEIKNYSVIETEIWGKMHKSQEYHEQMLF